MVHSVKSGSHVIVRPTDSDPSICGDHAVCDTLSNLILKNKAIFRDNLYSELEFQKGRHEVSVGDHTHLLVNASRKIIWQGNETAVTTISCESSFVFIFLYIKNLTLKNLTFSECGCQLPTQDHFISQYESEIRGASVAIALLDTSFHMQSVTISQSRGYGLLGLNLWGTNNVTSCHFHGNNTERSDGECTGGNAAFYFYTNQKLKKRKSRAEVTLSIAHSTFQNGTDWSDESKQFSCSELINKSSSHPIFRANGLAIIAGQSNYRVKLQVTNTNFSQNTGNGLHPAVWVHDYGGVADNRFEFINCSFEREGTLRISSLENKTCSDKSKCYSSKKNTTREVNQLLKYKLLTAISQAVHSQHWKSVQSQHMCDTIGFS